MKKVFFLFLTALLLAPTAWAVDTDSPVQERYTYSTWAEESIQKADQLHLTQSPALGDLRQSIIRNDFGEDVSALVALAYDVDYQTYASVQDFRASQDNNKLPAPIAQELGILQGREDGNLDLASPITRQEAAVMLARAYRTYSNATHDDAAPLTYADTDDIAAWAKADVQLVTHLGIMNGVGENRFHPTGTYTAEQCFATLVRLYEKTCQDQQPDRENPFSMTALEQAITGFWVSDYYLLDYVQTDKLTACAYIPGGGNMGGQKCLITVLDQELQAKTYSSIILSGSNAQYGDSHATIDKISISDDGTKVLYQATVERDVYPTDKDGNPGALLFAKGTYTVTIDLSTGEQTYTRADLP